MTTAVLVDGGFFVKIHTAAWRKHVGDREAQPEPEDVASAVHELAIESVKLAAGKGREPNDLYRILFYDCPPFAEGKHNPVTNQFTDFSKTATAEFRRALHEALKKKRKVALRFGRLSAKPTWIIRRDKTADILRRGADALPVEESDVALDIRQKGVDMKIGLDIAALAFKKMVSQIVLVSGDSDFVPAAKLARREGIDFVLNSMGNPINTDLNEHVDGLIRLKPNFPQIGHAQQDHVV